MDLSPIGRAALKAREGEVLTAYRDSVGIWTIGVAIPGEPPILGAWHQKTTSCLQRSPTQCGEQA